MSDTPIEEQKPAAPAPTAAPDAQVESDAGRISLYGIAGVAAFVSLVVGSSLLAGYHAIVAPSNKFAMVDVAGVLETKEVVFTEIITKPGVSDQDRAAAYEMVRQTGPQLDAALGELQKECDCIILAKAAVVGDGAVDLTPRLRARLGIEHVDVKAIQSTIRARMAPEGKEGAAR